MNCLYICLICLLTAYVIDIYTILHKKEQHQNGLALVVTRYNLSDLIKIKENNAIVGHFYQEKCGLHCNGASLKGESASLRREFLPLRGADRYSETVSFCKFGKTLV